MKLENAVDPRKLAKELSDNYPERFLVILRGLPGSGKSTFSRELQEEFYNLLCGVSFSVTCSADFYFIRPDGRYDWNPKLLRNAHDWCFSKVERAMHPGHMSSDLVQSVNCDLIVLDNTNIVKSHYQKYIDLAAKNGYSVREVIVGDFDEESIKEYYFRNVHGVSLETIRSMARKFEI